MVRHGWGKVHAFTRDGALHRQSRAGRCVAAVLAQTDEYMFVVSYTHVLVLQMNALFQITLHEYAMPEAGVGASIHRIPPTGTLPIIPPSLAGTLVHVDRVRCAVLWRPWAWRSYSGHIRVALLHASPQLADFPLKLRGPGRSIGQGGQRALRAGESGERKLSPDQNVCVHVSSYGIAKNTGQGAM